MPSLSLFSSTSLPAQTTADKSYGVKSTDLFRVSSSFDIVSEIPVYAMIDGTVLLQQQSNDLNKANLILRPHDQKNFKLPVKYIIYRGLKTNIFIEDTNLSSPNNKVKTSGSEFLDKMQSIQNQRAPGVEIPVKALFGNELTPANNKNIEDFFFKNLDTSSQLFTVDCGIELGKFTIGEVGIEVILENPEYFVTVDIAKKSKHEINLSGITDVQQRKWQKDLVRHFVDPAAFYGLHYDIKGGIEYRQGTNKLSANTPTLVYEKIINNFFTKNKVYLDIRNENGYSYNYYDNYVGTGTDADKELKIGSTASGIIAKEYYTNGWAIHIIDLTPGAASENEVFFALRVNDNQKPLLAGWSVNLTPNKIVDPPLSNNAANRVYFTDETLLISAGSSPEFTNTISFKIPNATGSTINSLATIVRIDYIKQPLDTTSAVKFPRKKFTDYIFGSTNLNIPWDTDDKIIWYTDSYRTYINAIKEIGFGGFMESGHIIDIDTTTPDNDRIILYAAPLNFFSYKGIEKDISFNAKGGVLNYDSVLNIIPDITINRTNLKISSTQNILSFSYSFNNKLKKAFFMLGVTKAEWQAAVNSTATALSNIHLKLFKLKPLDTQKTDLNGTKYYDYELVISGLKVDGSYQEVNTGITIYTLDHFIFSSKSFAEKYKIDFSQADQKLMKFINDTINGNGNDLIDLIVSPEEKLQISKNYSWGKNLNGLTKTNKQLFDLAPSDTAPNFKTIITNFKTIFDNIQINKSDAENALRTQGSQLIKYSRGLIREKNVSGEFKSYSNKDGLLYITRLICQIIIKNHPVLLSQFPNLTQEFSDLFEKSSRGIEPNSTSYPNFSKYFDPTNFNGSELTAPSGAKKILITGFDPFGAGADEEGYNSNPSGNIALALDGVKITNANANAIVRTAIFPVRYREFNKGWVETFVKPFISSVDLVVTISYGTHYAKNKGLPLSSDHAFHIDRFAARVRAELTDNNNFYYNHNDNDYEYLQSQYGKPYFESKELPFILNKLPIDKLLISNNIKIPKTNIVVNYGNNSLSPLSWKIFAKKKATGNTPIGNEDDYTYFFASPPYTGFPSYFTNIKKYGQDLITMRFESTDKKYFSPEISNSDYIPNIDWNKYKDPNMESNFQDFRIQPINGSGGGYLSNEIHYRVAYLREKIKNTLPNGHIHIGFLSDDNYQSRKEMMEDIKYILEKFLEAL